MQIDKVIVSELKDAIQLINLAHINDLKIKYSIALI